MHFRRASILGVGLMGASFALALKQCGLCEEIVGWGRTPDNLEKARERGIIDSFSLDVRDVCRESDIVMFATPVGIFTDIIKHIRDVLKTGAIVTDMGSVKGHLVYEMEALLPDGLFFVGGHPIAGSDRSGIDTASADIFRKARCIITPTSKTAEDAAAKIIFMWETIGSVVTVMDPGEHDRIFAAVSHLPHILAYQLVNTVADIDSSYLEFSGQGFKDVTRIAASNPELWRDICFLNRDNILKYIEALKANLDRVSAYLRAGDPESLTDDFRRARSLRENIG